MSPSFPGLLASGLLIASTAAATPTTPVKPPPGTGGGPRPAGVEYIAIEHTSASNTVEGAWAVNAYGAATTYLQEFEAAYDQNKVALAGGTQNANVRTVANSALPGEVGDPYRPIGFGLCTEVPINQRTKTGNGTAALYRGRSECSVNAQDRPSVTFAKGETLWLDISICLAQFTPQASDTFAEAIQWKQNKGGTPPVALNIKYINGQPFWCLDASANPALDNEKITIGPVRVGVWERFTIGVKLSDIAADGWVEIWLNDALVRRKSRQTLHAADHLVYIQNGWYRTDGRDKFHDIAYRSGLRVCSTRELAVHRTDMTLAA